MTLTLLTPSYGPDFESFRLLHRSVLECTDPGVVHQAIVPDADLALFRSLDSSRLQLIPESTVLPRGFVSTAAAARVAARIPRMPRGARFVAVNTRRPWPPVRSWMLQQILKLTVAARSEAETLVLIDSDVELIAPIDESRFRSGSSVVWYRNPLAITPDMPRHVSWHRTARRLLRLPDDGEPPYDDPIAGMVPWDPVIVRGLVSRLEDVAGRSWQGTIAREWEFSEYVLYGEYRQSFTPVETRSVVADSTGCLSWWDPVPMTEADAAALAAARRADDVALLIQSTSRTPLALRADLGARLRSSRA